MTFKPPLSRAQLHAIHERNKESEDVRLLLWEIARLHSVLLRANDVCRMQNETVSSQNMILEDLRQQVESHPIVLEDQARRESVLKGR